MDGEIRKVRSLGNSLIVALPPQFLVRLNIVAGDYVCVNESDEAIIIKKAKMNGATNE